MLIKFKIYPHWKMKVKEYYEVFIFSTYKDMYKYYLDTGGYEDLDFIAICRDLEIYKGDILSNKIGEILITKGDCKTGIITHECGHAVFQYLRKINQNEMWTFLSEDKKFWKMEEMYCQILGELTKQFVNKLYKNNII